MRSHGHCKNDRSSKVYAAWHAMHGRCTNPNVESYKNYGARGIRVCERWDKFENFLEDMGEPLEFQSIERKDVNGDYCPENCEWVDWKKQNSNKRNNRRFLFEGEMLLIPEIAKRLGVAKESLYNRLHLGWAEDRLFSKIMKREKFEWEGRMVSLQELCRLRKFQYSTVRARRQRGMPMEKWFEPLMRPSSKAGSREAK